MGRARMTQWWGLGQRKYERVTQRAYKSGRESYERGKPYPGMATPPPKRASRRKAIRFLRERSFELGWYEALCEDPRLSHKERMDRMEPIVFQKPNV